MEQPLTDIGWFECKPDDPEIVRQRAYLEANNGIQGIEILTAGEIERAVNLFHRDGFVLVENILNDEQIDFLARGCNEVIRQIVALDETYAGNRGSHRYSFGGSSLTRSQLHRPEWQMLLELDPVHEFISAFFGSSHYTLRAASGDFCLPGAVDYQRLHSDTRDWIDGQQTPFSAFHDPLGKVSIRDLPAPYICVNFLPQAVTTLNGPTRQIPGTQKSRTPIPALSEEPEWMKLSTVCPAPAGSVMIRDVRAWHGGTPNLSNTTRAIPNLEFYAPWFQEPTVPGITYQDYKKLSPRAQELTRYSVADSSEALLTGPTLRAP
ncbi:MAG: phytanoyl-CoA dioxygenase family protein [Pseudomonadales bacterium]|jgi:ectoine hydroxylase-related dioxygenase (phytanoyl-CoA dioxygenase family)|nr:phytanoyl-CoA dioxygenase family protein [Pseudomonadales bacterium]